MEDIRNTSDIGKKGCDIVNCKKIILFVCVMVVLMCCAAIGEENFDFSDYCKYPASEGRCSSNKLADIKEIQKNIISESGDEAENYYRASHVVSLKKNGSVNIDITIKESGFYGFMMRYYQCYGTYSESDCSYGITILSETGEKVHMWEQKLSFRSKPTYIMSDCEAVFLEKGEYTTEIVQLSGESFLEWLVMVPFDEEQFSVSEEEKVYTVSDFITGFNGENANYTYYRGSEKQDYSMSTKDFTSVAKNRVISVPVNIPMTGKYRVDLLICDTQAESKKIEWIVADANGLREVSIQSKYTKKNDVEQAAVISGEIELQKGFQLLKITTNGANYKNPQKLHMVKLSVTDETLLGQITFGTSKASVRYSSVGSISGFVLPGNTDVENVPVNLPDGYGYISGTIGMVDVSDGYLNLKEVSDVMPSSEPIVLYAVSNEQKANLEFRLYMGSELPSIYFYDLVRDNTDMPANISWLHETKDNEASGLFSMYDADGNEIASGSLSTLKGRGNSSWLGEGEEKKNPYNFKLDKKAELISEAGSAKKWSLLAAASGHQYMDGSFLNQLTGFRVYEEIGGDYALSFEPVEVYIEGLYRGMYLLAERVEINSNRIDIEEPSYSFEGNKRTAKVTDGRDPAIKEGVIYYTHSDSEVEANGAYVLEIDERGDGEAACIKTQKGMIITFKEPEFPSQEQVQEVAMYLQAFENAIVSETGYNNHGKYYTEYMDLNSLAKAYICSAVSSEVDALRKSFYLVYDPSKEGAKLSAGSAWDYDQLLYNFDNLIQPNSTWGRRLLSRGEFVRELAYVVSETGDTSVKAVLEILIEENYWKNAAETFAETYSLEYAMWGIDRNTAAQLIEENYFYRYNRFFDESDGLFSGKYLNGVTVYADGNTVKADIQGDYSSIQWYKLSNSNPMKMHQLNNKVKEELVINESGTYIICVRGLNMQYFPESKYANTDKQISMYAAITVDLENSSN